MGEKSDTLLRLGRPEQALPVAQQANEMLGERLGLKAEVLFRLGATLHANGRHQEAETVWDDALRTALELGAEVCEGWVYQARAQQAWANGKTQQAKTLLTKAIEAYDATQYYRAGSARETLRLWEEAGRPDKL